MAAKNSFQHDSCANVSRQIWGKALIIPRWITGAASSDLTLQPRRDYTWCLTVLFSVRFHTRTHHAPLALQKSRPIARSRSILGRSFFRVPNVARLGFAGVSSPVWVDATSLRGSEKLGETDNLSRCASGPLCETLSSKARLPMPDLEAAPGGVEAPAGRLTTVN